MPHLERPTVRFAIELARPDVITQRELQAILDLNQVMDELAVNVRLRMAAGAVVEPGALFALSESNVRADADHLNKSHTSGIGRYGLTIEPIENSIESKEKQPCQKSI